MISEDGPGKAKESASFRRFAKVMRALISVPKDELDRELRAERSRKRRGSLRTTVAHKASKE